MKVAFKKAVSLVLSIAMILGIFAGLPVLNISARAIGETANVDCQYFLDSRGYYYEYDFRGQNMVLPNGSILYMFGGIPKLTTKGKVAYCVQSNATAGSVDNTSVFEITDETQAEIDLALCYGYTGTTKYGKSDDVERMATQIIVWCILDGWFNNSHETKALNIYTAGMTSDTYAAGTTVADAVKSVYAEIKSKIVNYSASLPSFNSSTSQKMGYDKASGTWKLTLTDSNGVLGFFDWSDAVRDCSYLSVSTYYNQITFTSTQTFSAKNFYADFEDDKFEPMKSILLKPVSGANRQECATYEATARRYATVSLYAEHSIGDLKIKKTSEDGKVSGISFTVQKDGVTIGNYTTNSNGEIFIANLVEGTYTVTENTPSNYEPQSSQTVTVKGGETAEVSFHNKPMVGDLKIIKTSDDGKIDGITFNVKKGNASIGNYITNSNGEILIEDLTIGTYTITEVVPTGYYAEKQSQTVTVNWNETATVNFKNITKCGNFSVTKEFIYRNGTDKDVTSNIKQAIISNIQFTLSGTSTTGRTINVTKGLEKEGADYVANFIEVPIGTYTLTEKLSGTAAEYIIAAAPSTVTVSYNGNVSKTISNDIKTGDLNFKKVVEYGNVNTIQFTLSGTSDAGIPINITANVTDKYSSTVVPWMGTVNGVKVYDKSTVTVTNGTVKFTNVPVGEYTLTESRSNDCYIAMTAKTNVAVVADMTVDYTGAINGSAVISNPLKRGDLKVIKSAEDNMVENVLFRLQGTSQSGENVLLEAYTNSSGVAEFNDVPIGQNYILTEVNVAPHYIPNNPITNVWIAYDKVNSIALLNTIEVYNWDKRGDLCVNKTIENSKYPENNKLDGFKFRLHGTSDSGQTVDITATTDSDGFASFKDVLIGTYTLEEIGTPIRYIIPEPQTVTVHWNGKNQYSEVINSAQANIPPITASFENNLKYFSFELIKRDKEYPVAQGEGTLEGAVYGVYDNGVLIDTYTTNHEGKFSTKEYECGYNWTVKEITPSVGYMLDEAVYHVSAEPSLYTVRDNIAPTINSSEPVKKGNFAILKTTGNGTGVYKFEVGAEFEVYLANAGSYANAKEYERDYLTIAEDGMATTKYLPFGYYTLHQTKAWDGSMYADDYTLFVGAEHKDYRIIPINNGGFESRIRVVKVDGDVAKGEEPKAIPIAGAAFKIYDPNGELIVQKVTYPSYMEYDTFYTNENGEFTTPEPLNYGEGYSLVEVCAPYGYVLNDEPIYFDVTALNADLENGLATITVVFPDAPQKGTIKVDKQGEVFATVTNENGVYQAQYAAEHLKGATYAIYAAEDIYTPDGTLRYAEGEEVDRITTSDDGTVTSKPLYLGSYNVVEVQTPSGMVLDATPMPVTLVYADQTVEILDSADISQTNDRQKAVIRVIKAMEINDTFGIGANGEIGAVSFGLYAGKDLTASDGTFIPCDGLIEVKNCDSEGKITFDSDLPFGKYYVQEVSTDKHYVLDKEKYEISFEYLGQDVTTVELTANEGKPITNELIYGLVGGTKMDIETGEVLGNAVIGLFAENTEVFTASNAIMVTTTNERGEYAFENVPYGSYLVRELKAPKGYVLNETAFEVKIETNGAQERVNIKEKPIYGSIELIKTDADDGTLLNGAKFEVWADANDNGVLDDEDEYVGLMTENNGVYTYTGLIFGAYFVREVEAPADHLLDDKDYGVEITDDGVTCTVSNNDKGTFDNKHIPKIGTKADMNGEKKAVAAEDIAIKDEVFYTNLYMGKEYTLVGILMDKATGEPLQINGETVTSTVVFVPENPNGSVIVPFTFNSEYLTDTVDLVVFETLYEGEREWAVHADIEDEDQTVRIYKPEIKTTASIGDEKEVNAVDTVTIKDVVAYKHLVEGEKYRVTGILMDKATGEALLINGEPVRSETEFTAPTCDGTVEVEFTFDISSLNKTVSIVVFENLFLQDMELAVHTDIEDEDQTVKIKKPEIKTTATSDDEKEINAVDTVVIKDVVEYKNLVVGKTYKVTGILMNKLNGEALLVNGSAVQSGVEFTAESEDGTIEVEFAFDAATLNEITDVVVFEELYLGDMKLATHADIDDEGQTVTIKKPGIKTTATSNGDHEEFMKGVVTIKDDIAYHNLVVNKEYTVRGVLMDKSTNKELLINGEKVTAETTFVAEATDGTVSVLFEFDTRPLTKPTAVVAFERLECNGIEIAVHADIEDKDQTVTFVEPSIGTKLAFNESEMEKRQQTVLDDVIYYHNLIAGREYTLYGTLRDENGDIYLDRKNQEARSELTFVPQTSDGEVTVQFVIDTSHLGEEWSLYVVAFEELYYNGSRIAAHEDINAEEQTAELFAFPDDDVPHGDQPPTGVSIKYSGVILATITLGTVITINRRKKRR